MDSERSWTPLDLEAGSIIWAIKRLRGHLWSTRIQIYSDHKALENIVKVGEHNAHVRCRLEFLPAYTYTMEYRKGTANGNANSLSRLHQLITDADRTGCNRLTGPETVGIYFIRPCDFAPNEPPTPVYQLGWARVHPFKIRSNNLASFLNRRRLRRLPPIGITH